MKRIFSMSVMAICLVTILTAFFPAFSDAAVEDNQDVIKIIFAEPDYNRWINSQVDRRPLDSTERWFDNHKVKFVVKLSISNAIQLYEFVRLEVRTSKSDQVLAIKLDKDFLPMLNVFEKKVKATPGLMINCLFNVKGEMEYIIVSKNVE